MTCQHLLSVRHTVAVVIGFAALAATPAHALDLPPGCVEAVPVTCRYQPSRTYAVGEMDLFMVDPSRSNHLIPFRVRYPIGATGALPVVLWSHGGSTTSITHQTSQGVPVSNGQTGSERRGRSFAAAGYVVVHIGRLSVRDATLTQSQLDDCRRIGIGRLARVDNDPQTDPRALCREFIGWHVYGPQNVAFVAGHLGLLQAAMPRDFGASLDRDRLVVGGWSGGTQAVMNIAGAAQRWAPVRPFTVGLSQPAVSVPGVVAFFADAPRRPSFIEDAGDSGFQDDTLFEIGRRPFLFNSGKNDVGPDVAPTTARTLPWMSAMPGGKVLAWDRTGVANHATVDLGDVDQGQQVGCVPGTGQVELCLAYADLGLAFLDAVVKRRPEAVRWMASDALQVLADRKIELHRR
ncbi:MAG: hypothetical protein ACKVQR_13970 [Aquabacterium sp.]